MFNNIFDELKEVKYFTRVNTFEEPFNAKHLKRSKAFEE